MLAVRQFADRQPELAPILERSRIEAAVPLGRIAGEGRRRVVCQKSCGCIARFFLLRPR